MSDPKGYPRPQLRRANWLSLNGEWQFALDGDAVCGKPTDVQWNATIHVPFSPETPASGIGDTGLYCACWYRRRVEIRPPDNRERVILHFGAVDYAAVVWVNGSIVIRHKGGYTPFRADITDVLDPSGVQEIVVRAEDDPADLAKPRGKQDWLRDSHSIWYPRTTGIWQTVWLEYVPSPCIGILRWAANLERWEIGLEAIIIGRRADEHRLHVELRNGDHIVADDTYAVVAGEVHRRIALSDPGIDDFRNALLWRPAAPILIDAKLELRDADGRSVDRVESYTALRSIGIQGDQFVLNGRPYSLHMVLDQGYWPETGLTAPSDEALKRDVLLAKDMGFNGVRKHQKVEDPRYLYWADKLGLLVWEEMPSAYRFTTLSIQRLMREWIETIERDSSHPCIVAWVTFNESWGVPDLPAIEAQRDYVQALYHLTKTLDPSRPVVGNDGWESVATDIIGIHDYDDDPKRLARRYESEERIPQLFRRERPGGRLLTIEGHAHAGQPIMLSEFGGIALSPDRERTWGYSRSDSAEQLAEKFRQILAVVHASPLLAGFCYTQFADTYQETNGLLYADRTPKIPLEQIAAAIRGPGRVNDEPIQREWLDRALEARQVPGATASPG